MKPKQLAAKRAKRIGILRVAAVLFCVLCAKEAYFVLKAKDYSFAITPQVLDLAKAKQPNNSSAGLVYGLVSGLANAKQTNNSSDGLVSGLVSGLANAKQPNNSSAGKMGEENQVELLCRSKKRAQVSASGYWNSSCSLDLKDSVEVFHLGKGGGGTMRFNLQQYRIITKWNHPYPPKNVAALQGGPSTTLLFNVRDPADRFVSAFYWEDLLICRDDNDNRDQIIGRTAHRPIAFPNEACFRLNNKEKQIVHEIYNHDVNELAIRLCQESPHQTTSISHVQPIEHANRRLVDWLHFFLDPDTASNITSQGVAKLLAITMEKQPNGTSFFDWHLHQAVQQLLVEGGFNEEEARSIQANKPQTTQANVDYSKQERHSSVTSFRASSINATAECCLVRYLEDDYRLIKTMLLPLPEDTNAPENQIKDPFIAKIEPLSDAHPLLRTACSWGHKHRQLQCRQDLHSMLKRRARQLDRSLGTCAQLTSTKGLS